MQLPASKTGVEWKKEVSNHRSESQSKHEKSLTVVGTAAVKRVPEKVDENGFPRRLHAAKDFPNVKLDAVVVFAQDLDLIQHKNDGVQNTWNLGILKQKIKKKSKSCLQETTQQSFGQQVLIPCQ
jgi:hypothetical protein